MYINVFMLKPYIVGVENNFPQPVDYLWIKPDMLIENSSLILYIGIIKRIITYISINIYNNTIFA